MPGWRRRVSPRSSRAAIASSRAAFRLAARFRTMSISSGSVVSVMSIVPSTPAASSTTSAPAQLTVLRNGSPMMAPNQPPACDMASTLATILSAPLTRWRKPRMASTLMPHPTDSLTRCSTLRRRTMATPITIEITGRANLPSPNSQPNVLSMPVPSGPAMCAYMDRIRSRPRLTSPMPQNSTSRPFATWASWDSPLRPAPDWRPDDPEDWREEGRRLPAGGVFTPVRPRDPGDDEREPLSDM